MSPDAVTIIAWLRADMKTDRAEAAADRRAFQLSMDGLKRPLRGGSQASSRIRIRTAAEFDRNSIPVSIRRNSVLTDRFRADSHQAGHAGRGDRHTPVLAGPVPTTEVTRAPSHPMFPNTHSGTFPDTPQSQASRDRPRHGA